jgi:hypothetical protein
MSDERDHPPGSYWAEYDSERGFEGVAFRDSFEISCSVQQSSTAYLSQMVHLDERGMARPGTGALWLGPDDNRMHLPRRHIHILWELLGRWLMTGKLHSHGDPEPDQETKKETNE